MNPRLLSLVFAPFAFGTSAFAFVGLIDPMAEGLRITVPVAGQLQTVFAIACGIGGPLLARLLGGLDRKRLLIVVMMILAVMNAASALAHGFGAIAAIRVAGGLFAALTLPLASTIAVTMEPESRRPAALATVLAGYTLAFLFGMPFCTLLGDAFGWRAAFWFAGAICAVAGLVIAIGAPAGVSAPQAAGANFRAALNGDNLRLMTITLLGFAATFATVSYIGPLITAFAGLEGAAIGGVQIATGVGSLLGLPAGAALAKLPIRTALAGLLCATGATQALFSLGMLVDLGWMALPVLVVAMALGSAALFATSPVIQTRLARSAGPAATIAFALNGSMIFFGQGFGATLGGTVTALSGIAWSGLAGGPGGGRGAVRRRISSRRGPQDRFGHPMTDFATRRPGDSDPIMQSSRPPRTRTGETMQKRRSPVAMAFAVLLSGFAADACSQDMDKAAPPPSAGPAESLVRTPIEDASFAQLLPGAKVFVVYGGVGTGAPTAQVATLDAGVSFARHIHTEDYNAVVIEGRFQHWEDGEPGQGPVMTAGSTFFQAGGSPHYDACVGPETCVVYVHFPVSADFEFVAAD